MRDPQQSVVFESYAKVPVSDFTHELAFEFKDLDSDAIPHYVLRAINRIARKGNVLRRTAFIHTQDCVNNYLLEPTDCTDIVAVMQVCHMCGNSCGQVARLTQQPCRLSCGTVSWFEAPNIIHFQPGKTGNIYRVQMAVAPTFDACEVDRILLTNYYDLVMDGAKSYLFAMADKPWSSENRAQKYREMFERGISAAAVDTMTGGQRGAIRVQRPRSV